MRNQKIIQYMKEFFKIVGTSGAILALLCLLIKGCNYLVVDDANSYTRLTLHDFYESEEKIETIFLGTSHCFRAYDPTLYGELTGESSYNLGSSSQNIDTSYYLLKEALKHQDIKKVYLDMYHVFLFFNPDNRELVEANIISDYMKPSLNKVQFILTRSDSKHYTNSFFPFRRDWQLLGDFEYLRSNIEKKQQERYTQYQPVVYDDEQYVAKGFVASTAILNVEEHQWIPKSKPVDLSEDAAFAKSYLRKIAALCEKENIELIFLTAPSYKEYIEEMDSYENVHQLIQNLADEYGVEYLDFNEYPEEKLNLGPEDFMDVDHLNGYGAKKVTECLANDILNKAN